MINRLLLYSVFCWTIVACNPRFAGEYVCPPCDLPCDTLSFDRPGICPHCHMKLVTKSELETLENIGVDIIDLAVGSGEFRIYGRDGHSEDVIRVFYHLPKNYGRGSKVLLVIPGAGRNGDSYRDAWVEESEKYGVIILSLMYDEANYPFENYHLGGLIKNMNLISSIKKVEGTNQVQLDERQLEYEIITDSRQWIFKDFDFIFGLIKEELKLETELYDVFGHSAGGQILHRLALFADNIQADRIIAANSGFYTLPDTTLRMPFGMTGYGLREEQIKKALSRNLFIFCGELDNANETNGTLLRSPSADEQGLHRLGRSKYFFEFGKELADRLDVPFHWELVVVPGIGHNHRKMGDAVGVWLYYPDSSGR